MKIFKDTWKKYKLISVVVFSMWWVPTTGKLLYPWLMKLGIILDRWFVSRLGGRELAPSWKHAVLAIAIIVAACGLLWTVRCVLRWLYSKC